MANLEDRFNEIEEAKLSKPFQDAINVVRKLNRIENENFYLWIDSLCIIQEGDHQVDWKKECSKMGQYYQHSIFTIAITDASSSGFLRYSDSAEQAPLVRLPYRDKSANPRGLFYVQPREYGADANAEYYAYVASSELMGRGWVFQESMLSRRILYYSCGRIFFECQTDGVRNRFNESIASKDVLSQTLEKTLYSNRRMEIQRMFAESSGKAAGLVWIYLIEEFSGLTFTDPKKDRIIALAGIASEVRSSMQSKASYKEQRSNPGKTLRYIAGCWEQYIHHELLWELKVCEQLQRSMCKAPSWSWSAWLNAVHWRSAGACLENACLVDSMVPEIYSTASIDSNQPYPASGFDGLDNVFAFLSLRGKAASVLLGPTLDRSESKRMAHYTGVHPLHTSCWRAIADPDKPDTYIGWANMDVPIEPTTFEHERGILSSIAVHIATQKKIPGGVPFGYWDRTHEVYCIVLVEALTGFRKPKNSIFKRSGVGRIYQKHFFKNGCEFDHYLI